MDKSRRNSIASLSSPFKDSLVRRSIKHSRLNQLINKSSSNIFNKTPNNNSNNNEMPVLIESRQYQNINLTNDHLRTSNFSNFSNYKSILGKQQIQKSKYFNVYHPKKESKNLFDNNLTSDSLSSSQSSLNDDNKSDNEQSRIQNDSIKEEIQNFNLHSTPVQFNMDKVSYVKSFSKAKSVVQVIQECSKIIALNCDSDCCLQTGIDLFEVAVTYDQSLDHPEIFVFDIYLEPRILSLFKPIFANPKIVKVMFDARFDLRILSRKYGINEFVALFDIQLAYRVLLSKVTNKPFDEVKREKLLNVSWQCNGPLTNFEKMQLPNKYYFKNKNFWRIRPMNFEVMYNAAYDAFVMVPQLFTNLVVIMERTLNLEHQQLFIKKSNELITRNLVPRKFAFFQSKHQYLGEIHKQIDLLIQSDVLHRNKQLKKWQNQLIDEEYYEDEEIHNFYSSGLLLKNQINDIDTDSYKSFSNSSVDLMSFSENPLANEDLFQSQNSNQTANEEYVNDSYGSGTHTTEQNEYNCREKLEQQCNKCKLIIKNDQLSELLNNLEHNQKNLRNLLFTGLKRCQCIQYQPTFLDEETKCMNLLVDQIIDLAECKEDFMELEE